MSISLIQAGDSNTSKIKLSSLKLAENEVLLDILCCMTKEFEIHLITMVISIIMLIKKSTG